jgi:hypothetical protein
MSDFVGILSESDFESLKESTIQSGNEWNRSF